MRVWHGHWKDATDEMELLLADPRKFVRKHGYLYDIKRPKEPKKQPKEPNKRFFFFF